MVSSFPTFHTSHKGVWEMFLSFQPLQCRGGYQPHGFQERNVDSV